MNTFYIARHGETENNKLRHLSGWIDTPLTPDGLVPTTVAINKLRGKRIDTIYSSDLGRAFVTAYSIARAVGYNKEIIRLSGLREVNYGDAGNMYSADAYKMYPRLDRDTHFAPPNGESLDQMQHRVLKTLADIDKAHNDKHLLIVAHSGDMAAIKSSFTGQDFGAHNISEAYAHEFVARFTIDNGRIASSDEIVAA